MLYTHNTSRTFFMGYKLPVDIMAYPSGLDPRCLEPALLSRELYHQSGRAGDAWLDLVRKTEWKKDEKRSCEDGRLLKRVEMHMDDESIVSTV